MFNRLIFILGITVFVYSCSGSNDDNAAKSASTDNTSPDSMSELMSLKNDYEIKKLYIESMYDKYSIDEILVNADVSGIDVSVKDPDVVVLGSVGGPDYASDNTYFSIYHKDYNVVYVKQSQHLQKPAVTDALKVEIAEEYNLASAYLLKRAIEHFKNQNKKVYVIGHSFGAFLIPFHIFLYGQLADKYAVAAGRLLIDYDVWKKREDLEAICAYAEDGITVTCDAFDLNRYINDDDVPEGETKEDFIKHFTFTFLLQSVLGKYNYLSLEKDLRKMIFVYGLKDGAVGRMSFEEVKFVIQKNATVKDYPINHSVGLEQNSTYESMNADATFDHNPESDDPKTKFLGSELWKDDHIQDFFDNPLPTVEPIPNIGKYAYAGSSLDIPEDIANLYRTLDASMVGSDDEKLLFLIQGGPILSLDTDNMFLQPWQSYAEASQHKPILVSQTNTMVAEQDFVFGPPRLDEILTEKVNNNDALGPNDISRYAAEMKQHFDLSLSYAASLVNAEIIIRVARHFKNQGKSLSILGLSYGGFLVQLTSLIYPEEFDELFDKVIFGQSRLLIPQEWIASLEAGYNIKFSWDETAQDTVLNLDVWENKTEDITEYGITETFIVRGIAGIFRGIDYMQWVDSQSIQKDKFCFITSKGDQAVGQIQEQEKLAAKEKFSYMELTLPDLSAEQDTNLQNLSFADFDGHVLAGLEGAVKGIYAPFLAGDSAACQQVSPYPVEFSDQEKAFILMNN